MSTYEQTAKARTTVAREAVLAEIRRTGGATCDEVEEALGLWHQSASARVRDLVLAGKIEDSGVRRKTRCGRTAIVWREKSQ